jgi:hypothetical protein
MSGDDITIRGFRLRGASYAGFVRTRVFEHERPGDGVSINSELLT